MHSHFSVPSDGFSLFGALKRPFEPKGFSSTRLIELKGFSSKRLFEPKGFSSKDYLSLKVLAQKAI